MVEHSAVNRRVVGSSPTRGARKSRNQFGIFYFEEYMFYTYVLYSELFDRIYIGQTNNLTLRLSDHNSGNCKSTKPYSPWTLTYYEEFQTRRESMKREKELKSHRGRDFIREMLNGRVRQLPD